MFFKPCCITVNAGKNMDTDSNEIESAADDIIQGLPDEADVDESFVREKLTELVGEFDVPLEEARRSVVNSVTDSADFDPSDVGGGTNQVLVNNVGDVHEGDGSWVNLEIQVDELWEPNHEDIVQVGLIGDDSGSNKFTAFGNQENFNLEEGKSYRIEGALTDEWNGDFSIKLNDTADITELDSEIEIGENTTQVSGVLINVYSDSGLIKRCPNEGCTYVLDSGRCDEHGPVDDHEFDFRVKGTLDDGSETHDVIFNQDTAEELAGIDIEDAKQIAKEEYDITEVLKAFEDDITGRHFTVEAISMYNTLMVDEFDQGIEAESTNELLVRARSI